MNKNHLCILFILAFFFIAGPVFAGPNDRVTLGGAIYRDLNLSLNANQSCMTCHHPSAGFADPANRISPALFPVSDGSDPALFGGRNAPEASYAGFSPIFHYDDVEGLFVGGLFWDGRATGRMDITATGGLGAGPTGDPLADQAKGPFGSPVEMALTLENTGFRTEEAVINIIKTSTYAAIFEKEFGAGILENNVDLAYNKASIAIAAFERSNNVNKFKSKFDKFVQEQGGDVSNFGFVLTNESVPESFRIYVGPPSGFKSKYFSFDEADGLAIFNSDSYWQLGILPEETNGGMCYLCHLTTNHVVEPPGEREIDYRPLNGPADGIYYPLLTDFTFDNLGIPVNPQIAVLAGAQLTDFGLGGQVAQLEFACDDYRDDKTAYPACMEAATSSAQDGKFKVSSLRNVSRTAPYGHNGYFATLYDIVHFYNTRDVIGAGWPASEVSDNVNADELGNLGLTLEQEQKLVMFLETLND